MHGQKLGRWVRQRESVGLALDAPAPYDEIRPDWLRRHRIVLPLCVLAVSLLTTFLLVRERFSYPAYVQSALRGQIREIRYEIHPGLWVTVSDADQITQIAGWLAEARPGEDRWARSSYPARWDGATNC